MSTLEPSSGGMGRQLNMASAMFIQTLAATICTSGLSMDNGNMDICVMSMKTGRLMIASRMFAPGPASDTQSIPFCGSLKFTGLTGTGFAHPT